MAMGEEGLIPHSSWRTFLWRLKRVPRARRLAIVQALNQGAEIVIGRAKSHYLTGAALKVQTGRLRSSVTKSPVRQAGSIYFIHVGTKVHYGRYWEEGFTIHGHRQAARRWLLPSIVDKTRDVRRLLAKAGVKFR